MPGSLTGYGRSTLGRGCFFFSPLVDDLEPEVRFEDGTFERRKWIVVSALNLTAVTKPLIEFSEVSVDFFFESLAALDVICLNRDHRFSMLRFADEEDLDALAELEGMLFPENSLNEKSLKQELTESVAIVWGKPARAYVLVRYDSEIVDILRVGVHPDFRRRGIGQLLVEEVLTDERPVMLTVLRNNEPAFSLYKKLGFEVVGATMPDFYAWTMVRWPKSCAST